MIAKKTRLRLAGVRIFFYLSSEIHLLTITITLTKTKTKKTKDDDKNENYKGIIL